MIKRFLFFFVTNIFVLVSSFNFLLAEETFTAINQYEIIKKSEEIKKNEIKLLEIKTYIENFQIKKNKLSDYIYKSANNFSVYLIAIYKLKKIPTELMLLKKTSTFEMAKINAITQSSLNFFISEIKKTIETINELEKTQKEINILYYQLNSIQEKLKKIDVSINQLMEKEEANSAIKNQQQKLKILSKESKNIYELLNKLVIKKNNDNVKYNEENLLVEKNRNNFVLPNTGIIAKKFKQSKNYFFSFGITIMSQENSIVVAPFDGVVLFADSFKEIGSMVVIQHSNAYTSIIIGDFDIKIKPTQLLKTNEIIGKNQNKISNIYFEIQKNGKSIDPISFIQK